PVLARDEQPSGDLTSVERSKPDELSIGQFLLGQFRSEAVDDGSVRPSEVGDEPGRPSESGMEVEQPLSLGMPDRMARGPLRGGDRASASACRGDRLELDVSIPVFQERDPFAVRGPPRPRLVPLALDEPSDPAPCVSTTNTLSRSPSRFERNAIRFPLGDHRGEALSHRVSVTLRAEPPAAGVT